LENTMHSRVKNVIGIIYKNVNHKESNPIPFYASETV